RQTPPVPLRPRARALCPRARTPVGGMARLADLPAGLLRPALPGVLAQPLRRRAPRRARLRPADLRRQLARTARARLEDPAARPRDREPVLRRRAQPGRRGRQRPAL